MTSVETLVLLEGQFDGIIKSLDIAMLMEHVRKLAPAVFARHFRGFRPQTLGRKRIIDALRFEVFEKHNTSIGDILTLLWNQEHRDVYHAMLAHVRTISEDVESIERIEDDKAVSFLDDLVARFDLADVLVCVRLNEVRFSPEVVRARLETPLGIGAATAEATTPAEQPSAPDGTAA